MSSRLIDADELIDGYRHMGYDPTEHEEESYMDGWCKGFNAAVKHCISHVIHAPTVTNNSSYTKITWVSCPYCGYGLPTYVIDDSYKFCSHCGRRVIKDAWVPEFYEEVVS